MYAARRPVAELIADRLAYWLLAQLRARASGRDTRDFKGIVVPIDDEIGWRVIATGRYELTHLDGVRRLIEHPELVGVPSVLSGAFVDIGANIGLYSLALARYFAKAVAFEANPYTFNVLQANVALSGAPNIECVCLGLSDRRESTSMRVALDGNLGWGKIDDSPSAKSRHIPVELETFDDWAARALGTTPVSLMKIDVEGHELAVLKGCARHLRDGAPVVLFEALDVSSGESCTQYLRDCGYTRFFEFARRLPAMATWNEHMSAMWRGLPVDISEIDEIKPGRHALLCAVKPVTPAA